MKIDNSNNVYPKPDYSYRNRIREFLGIKKDADLKAKIKVLHIPRELGLDLDPSIGEVSLEAVEENYKDQVIDLAVQTLWDFVLDFESASDSSLQKVSNIQKMKARFEELGITAEPRTYTEELAKICGVPIINSDSELRRKDSSLATNLLDRGMFLLKPMQVLALFVGSKMGGNMPCASNIPIAFKALMTSQRIPSFIRSYPKETIEKLKMDFPQILSSSSLEAIQDKDIYDAVFNKLENRIREYLVAKIYSVGLSYEIGKKFYALKQLISDPDEREEIEEALGTLFRVKTLFNSSPLDIYKSIRTLKGKKSADIIKWFDQHVDSIKPLISDDQYWKLHEYRDRLIALSNLHFAPNIFDVNPKTIFSSIQILMNGDIEKVIPWWESNLDKIYHEQDIDFKQMDAKAINAWETRIKSSLAKILKGYKRNFTA